MKPQTAIRCSIVTLLTLLISCIVQADTTPFDSSTSHFGFSPMLLASAEGKRLRTRQRGQAPSLSDPWALRVAEGGDFCYANPAKVRLWRDDGRKAAQLSISNNTDQHHIKVRWPARTASLAWPLERMPLTDGQSYLVDINQAITVITFHKIPTVFPTSAERSRWMVEHGCSHQVGILQSREESDASSE